MGSEFSSLKIPPNPVSPGLPFEAPSKLKLMKDFGGGVNELLEESL